MQTPHNEAARLKELARYAILDTPKDGAFDDLTTLAAQYFDVPIAIVSLVDSDRVWFKSAHGLDGVVQIDRGPGLCASAILREEIYVAPDLKLDLESLANPLVAKSNGFRFYAGTQLRSSGGYNLGTLCIIDYAPRELGTTELEALEKFGHLAMSQMELRLASRQVASLLMAVEQQNTHLSHAATHDSLTGLLNRYAIQNKLNELTNRPNIAQELSILLFDIDHFKKINDTYGHNTGDAVLIEVSKRITNSVRSTDYVGRQGGEEFIVLLATSNRCVLSDVAERIRNNIAKAPIAVDGHDLWITISGGASAARNGLDTTSMIKVADDALYRAKHQGRNRIAYSDPLEMLTGMANVWAAPEKLHS